MAWKDAPLVWQLKLLCQSQAACSAPISDAASPLPYHSCQMVLGPLWEFLLACLAFFFAFYLFKAFRFPMGLCFSSTTVWGKVSLHRGPHPTSCKIQVGYEALLGRALPVVNAGLSSCR